MVDQGELESLVKNVIIDEDNKCEWKIYQEEKGIYVNQPIPMEDMYSCVDCTGYVNSFYKCPNHITKKSLSKINGDFR